MASEKSPEVQKRESRRSKFFEPRNYIRVMRAALRRNPQTGKPAILTIAQYKRFIKALLGAENILKIQAFQIRRRYEAIESEYLNGIDLRSEKLPVREVNAIRIPKYFSAPGNEASSTEAMREFIRELRAVEYTSNSLWPHMDGQGDVVGRICDNLLILSDGPKYSAIDRVSSGSRVVFDARSLQMPGLRDRGIGVFAQAALRSIRSTVAGNELLLLTDPELPNLRSDLLLDSEQISTTKYLDFDSIAFLFQPSPMTSSPVPILDLINAGVYTVAIAYDFIPAEHPRVYLKSTLAWSDYLANLKVLEEFDEVIAISESVRHDFSKWVPRFSGRTQVAWPDELIRDISTIHPKKKPPSSATVFTIIAGNEPRKNIFGALRALRNYDCEVNVLGMASASEVVYEIARAVGFPVSNLIVLPRISEEVKIRVLQASNAVVMLSFAEGLSLPVAEGVAAGVPVLASRIPPHAELLGPGPWLAQDFSERSVVRSLDYILSKPDEVAKSQQAHLRSAVPGGLEQAIHELLSEFVATSGASEMVGSAQATTSTYIAKSSRRLSVGIATPWAPQPTGVADFSARTIPSIAELCDVTVYTVSEGATSTELSFRSLNDAYVDGVNHDVLVSIMGNSYFHLPMHQFLHRFGGMALCHDSAMLDFYDELFGHEASMNMRGVRNGIGIRNEYEKRGELPDLNFEDIAGFAEGMIFHSEPVAERANFETGAKTSYVPFIPMRQPPADWDSRFIIQNKDSQKKGIQIVSLGYLSDSRKLTVMLVEACEWLRQWGHDIQLTFVGGGAESQIHAVYQFVDPNDTSWLNVTGYVSEETMIKYLMESDLFVQLRLGDVQMMSGPVFDAAAYGRRGIVSENLADNFSLPSYISTVGNSPSPLSIAIEIQARLENPIEPTVLEAERRAFVTERNFQSYALNFLQAVEVLGA